MPKRCMRRKQARRGAAVVEFAVIAPVLLALLTGYVEGGRLCSVWNLLSTAAREGARLAAMDRDGILAAGQSTNDKITSDVRHYLTAAGLPGDQAVITIADADNPAVTLNLDDPANNLKLFRLSVGLRYSNFTTLGGMTSDPSAVFAARVVFRNARATIVQ
jgi:Flp pilus assembly protein TadG